jgi:hypothetical protein
MQNNILLCGYNFLGIYMNLYLFYKSILLGMVFTNQFIKN